MPSAAPQKNYAESLAEEFDRDTALENVYLRSVQELEDKYERERARLGDQASEDPDCELLRAQLELARAECDRAGALKFKSFIHRHRELFDDRDGRPAVTYRETENGPAYVPSPETANRRYLFVKVGELGRLNKDGHNQAAGDAGLEAVVEAVARVAGDRLKNISVFRYSGNDYMVEFADISETEIRLFEERLLQEKLELKGFPDVEAPPLSVMEFSFAEVLEIMSSVDLNSAEAGERDAFEAAAETVSITTRYADYGLAQASFVKQVARAVEKLAAAKHGEITRDAANAFFETYVKKGLYGSGLNELKDVEELWQGGRDLADYDRAVELMSTEFAVRQMRGETKFDEYEKFLVNGLVREYLRSATPRETAAPPPDFFAPGTKLARIPSPEYGTEGLRALAQKKRQIGSRQTGDAAKDEKWRRVDATFYQAEVMDRDLGTGLLERGKFYEELGREIESNEPFALIFIDLGFLKYFNDSGRRAVGDAALLKAAEIMETALIESDAEGRVYRYGGDEFTIVIKGGRAEAEEIKTSIGRLSEEAGRIPDLRSLREQGLAQGTTGDSRSDYAPMELVFNFGLAEKNDVIKLVNDLDPAELKTMMASGRRSPEQFRADLMVKLADASVAYEKAVSRFHELLDMMAQPGYADKNSAVYKRTEAVIAASQKAIFAGLGGDAALRFWAEGQGEEDPAVLDEQIKRFVSDRTDKMSEIMKGKKDLIGKLIDIHATRNRLGNRVNELLKELDEDDARIAELRARLNEADEARRLIIKTRQTIANGGIDKAS